MKRAFFVVMCCVFGLLCEVGYSQWFWFPGYSYGYQGGCANGQCYRSYGGNCANGQCGRKKTEQKSESEAVPTDNEKAANESLVQDNVKAAVFMTADIEKPIPTAELTGGTDEAVETGAEEMGQEESAVKESEDSDSETDLIVPTPNDSDPIVDEGQKAAEPEAVKDEFVVCPFTAKVIELINWHRSQFGLSALKIDNSLVVGCQNHSRYMASYGFGHAYGIGGMECIAMGVSSPEAVVNMWLNSSGHRAIIMSRSSKIGFGSFGSFHTLRVR